MMHIRRGRRLLTLVLVLLAHCFVLRAAHGEAQSPHIRNVLFIIADDLRANVLGCYGDEVCQTPNIDRLASRGMLFERAYCQATWCAPSRQSFMFSRYTEKNGINVGEHFKNSGWYSARVGKIYHMRVPGDIIAGTNGNDVASSWTERFNSPGKEAHTPGDYECLNQNIFTRSHENRESTKMPHRPFVAVHSDGDGSDQPDYKSATKAIELLQTHREEKFFLAVGFIRPHYPMVQPDKYFKPYPWESMKLPDRQEDDTADIPKLGIAATNDANNGIGRYPDNQKRMWSAYYASVSFMDEQVGRVLDELDRLGLTDSTAVVFTSDHGYHLGDHGFWQKSNLHEQVIRVPMIMSAPGFSAGRSDSLVELLDIYPTVADLAGLPIPNAVQGKSLVPILKSPKVAVREAALSLHRGGHSLRAADWQYIRYKDGSTELYDMATDANQFINLAEDESHQDRLANMHQQLVSRLGTSDLTLEESKKRERKK